MTGEGLYERCMRNALDYWQEQVAESGMTFSEWLRTQQLVAWTWADYSMTFEKEEDRVAFVLRWS